MLPKGLGLAGLGVVFSAAQKGLRHGAGLLQRRLLVDVDISVKDESYQWLLHWMKVHQQNQMSANHPSLASKGGVFSSIANRINPRMHHLSISTEKLELANGQLHTRLSLVPGPGRHFLRYRNAFFMVDRVRETKSINLQSGKPWETIKLTTLYSKRHLFEDLFNEAHQLAEQSTEGKMIVYISRGASWEPFGDPRRKRPLDSVILDKGIKEHVVADVNEFLRSDTWYYDRGIPYRRGYLLYGPPGSGKSSFVQALAGKLDYSIAILNLSERGLTDDRLNHLLTIVPKRCLVLLEDADAVFTNRRTQTDADGYRGANVTFSGLLNALDGVASAEERILFLTTNYPERLDPALKRPGRIDMSVRLGEATRWQAACLWDRFYGDLDADGRFRDQFLAVLEEQGVFAPENGAPSASKGPRPRQSGVSTALLQGLFLYNKGDMQGAIDAAKAPMVEDHQKLASNGAGSG